MQTMGVRDSAWTVKTFGDHGTGVIETIDAHSGAVRLNMCMIPNEISGNEYRSLVEQAPIMIWQSNITTECDYFNERWCPSQ
jgi:hypothetical protein